MRIEINAAEKGVTNALVVRETYSLTFLLVRRHNHTTRQVMSMTIRNSLEITAEILSLCKEPRTKTQVMYGANLSWRLLQKYLPKLQSNGLLKAHHSRTEYITTPKGLRFVRKWRELVEIL